MGVGNEEVIEKLSKKMKSGGHVITEIENQVQCLREKLAKLEKFLPQNVAINLPKENITSEIEGIENIPTTCTIDEINEKETFLNKQIDNIECIAKIYMRKIIDTKGNPIIEEEKQIVDFDCIPVKDSESVMKEKSSESIITKRKLYSSSENLKENRRVLSQGSQNLSRALNDLRGDCSDVRKTNSRVNTCSQKFSPRSNCHLVCNCSGWKKNSEMKSSEREFQKTFDKNEQLPKYEDCTCYETFSSSSDSEGHCDCLEKVKTNSSCKCQNMDDESESSDSSCDGQTIDSEISRYTCFCSKNQSHDEFEYDSEASNLKNHEGNVNIERFRGGLDTKYSNTTIVNVRNSQKFPSTFTSLQSVFVDHLRFVRFEELREGLERLKMRNRHLRDFLDNLDNTSSVASKPSEVNSLHTQISSCFSLDLERQTRSGLLTVVKILENKCRNKDAIIIALSDELKARNTKSLVSLDKEPLEEKSEIWMVLDQEKDVGRKFTKKDSAIGFFIFLMILISHVKRSEMVSYLCATKKILTESPFNLVLFINESEKFSFDFLTSFYKEIENLTRKFIDDTIFRWREIIVSVSRVIEPQYMKICDFKDYAIPFIANNQIQLLYTIIMILSTLLMIAKLRKSSSKSIKSSDYNIKYILTRPFTLIYEQIFVSRIFWLILGIFIHIIWNNYDTQIHMLLNCFNMNIFNNTQIDITENFDITEENDDSYCTLFDDFEYSWILSAFCTKFQSMKNFTYYIIKNV